MKKELVKMLKKLDVEDFKNMLLDLYEFYYNFIALRYKDYVDAPHIRELADLLGGELAGSRPLIDSGLLPHEAQIGQSGKSVAPELLINVGLSGSVQYRVGMKSAKRIMSINTAASAPVFDISGYGAVADYRSLVPALIKEIKKRRGTD